MSKIIFNDAEISAVTRAIRHLVVRGRTGELGIIHGADRFISTNDCFRRSDLDNLESAFTKLGITLDKV